MFVGFCLFNQKKSFLSFVFNTFSFFLHNTYIYLVENKTWEEIREALISSSNNKTTKYWLDQTQASCSEKGVVTISVPSVFIKDSFEKKFGKNIKEELVLRSFSSEFRLVVDENLSLSGSGEEAGVDLYGKDRFLEKEVVVKKETFSLLPFDSFYTGSSNNLAVVAAKTVAKEPGKRFNPLFIYGRPGVGKTFLLKTLKKTREDAFYVGSEEFLNSFVQSIKNGSTEDFRGKVRSKNLLLLDDVQFLAGKKAVSEELLHTLNHYIENGKGVVLVSDVKPKELVGFPERLISRVYSGLVTDIERPDKDLLCTFIKNSEVQSGLSKKLITRLSSFPFENFREVEGLLNTLSINKKTNVRLDVFVERFLKEKGVFSITKKTPEELVFFVSNKYQVDKDLLFSKNRTERVSNARHVLVGLLRKHTDMSLKQIGIYLGNRSHSTILSSLNKLERNKDLLTDVVSFDNLKQKERAG